MLEIRRQLGLIPGITLGMKLDENKGPRACPILGRSPNQIVVAVAILTVLLGAASADAQSVVITNGGTYSGYNINWTDSAHPAILIETSAPVTISNSTIVTVGQAIASCDATAGIYTIGTHVTIDSCNLEYDGPNPEGNASSKERLVFIYEPAYFSATHNYVSGAGAQGMIVWGNTSGTSNSSASIVVACNDFVDCQNAVQYGYLLNDPNLAIYFNRITQTPNYNHGDNINIFDSSGTKTSPVNIQQNFVYCNPDAPQTVAAAGIQAGDKGDSCVSVYGNFVLNGPGCGICIFYANGNTGSVDNNTVLGMGYDSQHGYSSGISVATNGGSASENSSGWWSPYSDAMVDYDGYTGIQNGNTSWDVTQVTLNKEQKL